MKKILFTTLGLILLFSTDAFAGGSTDVLNNYVGTVQGLIDDKIQYIGITLVMIFSGILAWKNASIAPLGWGAAASIVIAASGSIGNQLKNLSL